MSIDYQRKSPFDEMRNPEFSSKTQFEAEVVAPEEVQERAEQAKARAAAVLQSRKNEEAPHDEQNVLPDRCEACDVVLDDGRVISMRKPNIAVQLLSMKLLGGYQFKDEKMMSYALTQARAVLHVEAINGKPIERPSTEIEYKKLLNDLGDIGMEAVMAAFIECFPPVQMNEFKILKKS